MALSIDVLIFRRSLDVINDDVLSLNLWRIDQFQAKLLLYGRKNIGTRRSDWWILFGARRARRWTKRAIHIFRSIFQIKPELFRGSRLVNDVTMHHR